MNECDDNDIHTVYLPPYHPELYKSILSPDNWSKQTTKLPMFDLPLLNVTIVVELPVLHAPKSRAHLIMLVFSDLLLNVSMLPVRNKLSKVDTNEMHEIMPTCERPIPIIHIKW